MTNKHCEIFWFATTLSPREECTTLRHRAIANRLNSRLEMPYPAGPNFTLPDLTGK